MSEKYFQINNFLAPVLFSFQRSNWLFSSAKHQTRARICYYCCAKTESENCYINFWMCIYFYLFIYVTLFPLFLVSSLFSSCCFASTKIAGKSLPSAPTVPLWSEVSAMSSHFFYNFLCFLILFWCLIVEWNSQDVILILKCYTFWFSPKNVSNIK